MGRGPNYTILPGDWHSVEYAINDLCSRIINEDASFSSYLRADGSRALSANWAATHQIIAANFVSTVATGTAPFNASSITVCPNLNASFLEGHAASYFQAAGSYQPLSSNLTSLAGLTYALTSFVKMTSANTFSLDTNTYYKSGDSPTFATGTFETISFGSNLINITNDGTVSRIQIGYSADAEGDYSTAVGYDAHTTGYRALALGYGTDAQGARSGAFGHYAQAFYDDQIVFATGYGVELDIHGGSADFQKNSVAAVSFIIGTYNLTISEWAYLDGQDQSVFTTSHPTFAYLGVGTAPESIAIIKAQRTLPSDQTSGYGIYGDITNTSTIGGGYAWGLDFGAYWNPTSLTGKGTPTLAYLQGALINIGSTMPASAAKDMIITQVDAFAPYTFSFDKGSNPSRAMTVVAASSFRALNPTLSNGATITTLYAFYDPGMTVGGTNWGLYGLSTQNYLSGSLDAGSYKVGSVAGVSGTIDLTKTATVVNGIITSIA